MKGSNVIAKGITVVIATLDIIASAVFGVYSFQEFGYVASAAEAAEYTDTSVAADVYEDDVVLEVINDITEENKVETEEAVIDVEAVEIEETAEEIEVIEVIEVEEIVADVTTETTDDVIINQVISLINQYRSADVVYSSELTAMAQARAAENAVNDWDIDNRVDGHHMRPDGRKASTICDDFGVYGQFGENLGCFQETPEEIVEGWVGSASHFACMTNANYSRVGIGYAYDSEGYIYWVAIFMD